MAIELPWPPRELHPNARPHFHVKAKAAKSYRESAYWLTKAALPEGGNVLRIQFLPPDRRRRDLDGMLSSIKSGIDGIADAMEVDDHMFDFNLSRGAPVKGGKVIVEVETQDFSHGLSTPIRGKHTQVPLGCTGPELGGIE